MGDVSFTCRGEDCTEEVTMDETSLHFIANSAGVREDEVKRCEDCLGEWLADEDTTLNIGVGSTHSAASTNPNAGPDAVSVVHLGRERAFFSLPHPSDAPEDLKKLDYETVNYRFHDGEGVWSVPVEHLVRVLDHMEDAGWQVERDEDTDPDMRAVEVVGHQKEPGGMRRTTLRAPRQAEDVLDDVDLSAKPEFEPVSRQWAVPSADLDAVMQAFEHAGWRVVPRASDPPLDGRE